ncbi:MAG: cytochrome C oxidase subunit IV family protein [Vicinamibacteria bacterium]
MSAPTHHTKAVVAHTHPEAADHEHHGPTVKMYIAIFLALCVLTIVTVVTAKIDFAHVLNNQAMGDLASNVVALGIACTKATLVILFFMHVKYENKLVGLAVVASVIWLSFLLLITTSDYMTRVTDWHLFTK